MLPEQEAERSEGSASRLLAGSERGGVGGGGLTKWRSLLSSQEKFRPEDVVAETIATSEKVHSCKIALHGGA